MHTVFGRWHQSGNHIVKNLSPDHDFAGISSKKHLPQKHVFYAFHSI